jgi:predicted HTH domain antitoxin
MKSLNINVPDKVHLDSKDTSCFLAAKLYESGRLTLAQAAQMVEMKTVEFAEILSQYGVSLLNYPASDITKDVTNA